MSHDPTEKRLSLPPTSPQAGDPTQPLPGSRDTAVPSAAESSDSNATLEPTAAHRPVGSDPYATESFGLGAVEFEVAAGLGPGTQKISSIGPYKLRQRLGAGGMGEVWVAEQSEPVRRRVALKLIKGGVGSKEIIARFEAERQALALMNHPNIARILDAGTTPDGQPYFVMELVAGKPLTQYCDEHKLSIDQRLKLFIDVCAGVQHAHQKGIIHRDLKPGNIIVGIQDGVSVPKIIDFGLAKAMESTQRLTDQSLFTGIGQILGTLKYMSPEQASLDNLDIDTRTDIYALGVILYELLTGSTPLDDSSIKGQAALKILEFIRDREAVKPSSKLGSSTDEQVSSITGQRQTDSVRLKRILLGDLDWIVMKALEKDRTRRYDSASGFAADIRRYLDSEPVIARPPSLNYRIRKFVRKNRVGVLAAAVVLLTLVGGIIGTSLAMFRALAAERLAEERLADANTARDEESKQRQLADSRFKEAEQARKEEAEQRQLASQRLQQTEKANKIAEERAIEVEREKRNALEEARRALAQERVAEQSRVAAEEAEKDAKKAREISAIEAARASHEAKLARNALEQTQATLARSNYLLANLRWRENRAAEANELLWSIPKTYRGFEWNMDLKLFQGSAVTLYGHPGIVNCVAFSQDGTKIVSGCEHGTLKLWDAVSGMVIKTLRESGSIVSPVRCVAFSPDSTHIAAGIEKAIKIFDVAAGIEVLTLEAESGRSISLAYSPDGKQIISGSDSAVKVWDAETGRETRNLVGHNGRIQGVAYSPDGKQIISSALDGEMKFWNVETGLEAGTFEKDKSHDMAAIAFSPNGTQIASASVFQGIITLWDPETGRALRTWKAHESEINSVGFSPDGSCLATASGDHTIKIWNAATGSEIGLLKGHNDTVMSLAYSPDGTRIASTSKDHTLKIWDVATFSGLRTLQTGSPVICVASSPKDAICASGHLDHTLRLWNLTTGREIRTLKGHTAFVKSLALRPDGTQVVSGSGDSTIKIWDAITGDEIRTLEGHTDTVMSLAFSPNGMQIVSGGADSTIKVWDATTGNEIRTLKGHAGAVESLALSPNGTKIVSGSGSTIKIWDAITGDEIRTLEGHANTVMSLAFSPNGMQIVSAGWDKTVRIWDAETGNELRALKGHKAEVLSVACSADGTRIVSAGGDNTVRLWDAERGSELRTLQEHTASVTSVVFSQGSDLVVSGSWDGSLKLWETVVEGEFGKLRGSSGRMYLAGIHPDGTSVIGLNDDRVVLRWEISTGNLLPLETRDDVTLSFSLARYSDGNFLVIPDGTEVLIVDLTIHNSPQSQASRQFHARPKPWWHREQADAFFKNQDWYAATIHRAWVIKNSPESDSDREALRVSYQSLLDNDRKSAELLPHNVNEIISQALELQILTPRQMSRLQAISDPKEQFNAWVEMVSGIFEPVSPTHPQRWRLKLKHIADIPQFLLPNLPELAISELELNECQPSVVGELIPRCTELTKLSFSGLVPASGLDQLSAVPHLKTLNFQSGSGLSSAALQGLPARFPGLRSLWFNQFPLEGADLRVFGSLTELERLVLFGAAVNDQQISQAVWPAKLQYLELGGNPELTGRGLAATLLERQPWYLSVYGTACGNEFAREIAQVKSLRFLGLGKSNITDAGLPELALLTGLETLELQETQVRSAGLAALKPLVNLKTLDISQTAVDDSALEVITGFTGLQVLKIKGTQLSEQGLKTIQAKLPNCQIMR